MHVFGNGVVRVGGYYIGLGISDQAICKGVCQKCCSGIENIQSQKLNLDVEVTRC